MNYKEALKELLDENIWIDEKGDIYSQWKEDVEFKLSDEAKEIVTKLYYEQSDKLVPPKPCVPNKNTSEVET